MDILCLDPGETTGWCVLRTVPLADPEGRAQGKFALTVHAGGQSATWHEWIEWVCKVDAVVVERFALYAQYAEAMIGSEFVPSQVIGVAKREAEQCGVEVVVQPASIIHYRKDTINPALKPTVDALTFGKQEREWRHMRDAVAHGVHLFLHTTRWRRRAEADARKQTGGNEDDNATVQRNTGASRRRRAHSSASAVGRTGSARRPRGAQGGGTPRHVQADGAAGARRGA